LPASTTYPTCRSHATAYRAIALRGLVISRRHVGRSMRRSRSRRTQDRRSRKQTSISRSAGLYDDGRDRKSLEHARIGADRALSANGLECACAGYFGVGRAMLEQEHHLDDALSRVQPFARLWREGGLASATFERSSGPVLRWPSFEKGMQDAIDKLSVALQSAKSINDEYPPRPCPSNSPTR
jgi:hypothetical protein